MWHISLNNPLPCFVSDQTCQHSCHWHRRWSTINCPWVDMDRYPLFPGNTSSDPWAFNNCVHSMLLWINPFSNWTKCFFCLTFWPTVDFRFVSILNSVKSPLKFFINLIKNVIYTNKIKLVQGLYATCHFLQFNCSEKVELFHVQENKHKQRDLTGSSCVAIWLLMHSFNSCFSENKTIWTHIADSTSCFNMRLMDHSLPSLLWHLASWVTPASDTTQSH